MGVAPANSSSPGLSCHHPTSPARGRAGALGAKAMSNSESPAIDRLFDQLGRKRKASVWRLALYC
jgi:hypothetical protein